MQQSPLAVAFDRIASGDVEQTRSLLLAHPELANLHTFFAGGTLLHYAAAKSSVAMIELLVAMGFDVAVRGKTYQDSALHCACTHGRIENVRALLRLGAPIEQHQSFTDPVFGAIVGKSPETLELLASSGADLARRHTLDSGEIVDPYRFAILKGEHACAAVVARLLP